MHFFLQVFLSFFLMPFMFFRKKDVWLFYSNFGYKDSTRYLFEEAVNSGINAFYITNDVVKDERYSQSVVSPSSTICYWLMLRANVLFLTHGFGSLPLFIFRLKVIQLWHGVPIKKILFDTDIDTVKFSNALLNKCYLVLYKYRIHLYDYVISTGKYCTKAFSSAFVLPQSRIIELGSPRQEYMRSIAKSHVIKPKQKDEGINILYIPTWRETQNELVDVLLLLSDEKFTSFICEFNINFLIKPHPFDSKYLEDHPVDFNCKNIKIIKDDFDLSDTFVDYDGFIFDYSSAIFDLSCVTSNVFVFAPDYHAYESKRGVYCSIKELAGDAFSSNTDALKSHLLSVYVNGKSINNNISSFEEFTNSCSIQNIINFAKKL